MLVTEGPDAVRELISLGTVFDHTDGRRAVADPGGRPPPRPDRARRRRRHRRGDPAGAGRRRARRPRHRGHRARPGARPGPRRRRRGRRGDPARDGRGPARRRRRGALPGGGAGQRRPRPGVLRDHQPVGLHRRRDGARAAGRRGAARPGVRAVPPDRDVARRRLQGPAAADLRGGARRGRVPRRRRGVRFMQGQHELADLAPARRGGQGDHAADARDRRRARVARRPALRRREVGAAVPDDPRRPAARTASTR